MEWREQGILLSVRRHGETGAIIETLSPEHGRCFGLVRGGAGRRMTPTLQPGNDLDLTWRARTAEQLGNFSVELIHARADGAMADREALATLDSVRAMLSIFLPEREPAPVIHKGTHALLDVLADPPTRRLAYARWEIMLLEELGFALDLSRCAASGTREGLCYVSPRTGRAVSRDAGAPYADRMLPLPEFLTRRGEAPDRAGLYAAMTLTGHFLQIWASEPLGHKEMPPARQRLMALLNG